MFSLFSRKRKMKVFNSRIYKNSNNNKLPKESRERRIKAKTKLNELEYKKIYRIKHFACLLSSDLSPTFISTFISINSKNTNIL